MLYESQHDITQSIILTKGQYKSDVDLTQIGEWLDVGSK